MKNTENKNIKALLWTLIYARKGILTNKKDGRTMRTFEMYVEAQKRSIEENYLLKLIKNLSENQYNTFNHTNFTQSFVVDSLLHILLLLFPSKENLEIFSFEIQYSHDEYVTKLYSKIINTK